MAHHKEERDTQATIDRILHCCQVFGGVLPLIPPKRAIAFDWERFANYVLLLFTSEGHMVRTVAEEVLALASITLFLAMVAIWAQVLGVI